MVEEENYTKLMNEKENKAKELEILKNTTIEQIWLRELKELEKAIGKYRNDRKIRQFGLGAKIKKKGSKKGNLAASSNKNASSSPRVTVSNIPGTTLDFLKLKMPSSGTTIIDIGFVDFGITFDSIDTIDLEGEPVTVFGYEVEPFCVAKSLIMLEMMKDIDVHSRSIVA